MRFVVLVKHLCRFLALLPIALRADSPPNILFIMADDLGYGDLSCYNETSKVTTPHLDALAKQGMRFTDSHTPSAVCTPTRYGVLTGRYCWRSPLKSGVLSGDSAALIPTDRETVASLAKKAGLRTGVVGKWHLGLGEGLSATSDYSRPIPHSPVDLGFDFSHIIPASLDMAPYFWLENGMAVEAPTIDDPGSQRVWDGGEGFWRAGKRAPSFTFNGVLPNITKQSQRFLTECAATKSPFLLYVPFASPHTPWVPNQNFKGKTAAGVYGDFVHETDAAIGAILKTLDDLNLASNTLVIVTSDNGSHWPQRMIDETGHRANGPWRGQKADIHEAGHRVPFIVRWPGRIAPGSTSKQLICLTDFMATTAAALGVTMPETAGEDSFNLLPIFTGEAKKPVRKAVVNHSIQGLFAIREGQWKLILGKGSGGFTSVPKVEGEPEGQLYHLENDPGETHNLYNERPKIVARLTALLDRYKKEGHSRPNSEIDDLEQQVLQQDQVKRVHQELLRAILKGQAEAALAVMKRLPEAIAKEAETPYMRAVAHTALGQLDAATADLIDAVSTGLPIGRFLGGTKTGLEPLRETPLGRELIARNRHLPATGPLLGRLSSNAVSVWVRTLEASEVQVEASTSPDFSDLIRSNKATSNESSDFTALVTLSKLAPNTLYHYRVLIDGSHQPVPVHSFRTPPITVTGATKFRFAFGGGAGYVPQHERMWSTIQSNQPNLFLMLGDNVYSDDPETPAMQHYCYYRRMARPEFAALAASTAIFSIWDDHDFGVNDCAYGPEIAVPPWKPKVYRVFQNNWANPAYGGGDTQPGCYYDFMLGDVHFIMLDGRYYRNVDPEKGEVSMLGAVQRQWLLDTLTKSTGTFKVLCSPVPWVYEAKGDSPDTWNGFKEERSLIFNHLTSQKIAGVVLFSADRHRSDLWKIEREGAYPLYEFCSSRLTNQHVHPTMPEAIFSYNAKQSFGRVDVDTTLTDPTLNYAVINIDGEVVHDFKLQLSQLR